MDVNRVFEIEYGLTIFDGPTFLGGVDLPNFTENVVEGSYYVRKTGEKYVFIGEQWVQIQSKQLALMHNVLYDDYIPENYLAECYSPDLNGEIDLAGEILVL